MEFRFSKICGVTEALEVGVDLMLEADLTQVAAKSRALRERCTSERAPGAGGAPRALLCRRSDTAAEHRAALCCSPPGHRAVRRATGGTALAPSSACC